MMWQCVKSAQEHLNEDATEVRVFTKQGHLYGKILHLCGSLNFEEICTLNTLPDHTFFLNDRATYYDSFVAAKIFTSSAQLNDTLPLCWSSYHIMEIFLLLQHTKFH